MIDWDDVRYFLAVARGGSVRAAAGRLGVNHSTVLRRLGALEGALGARLFDRLPRGYVLTAEGHEFAASLGGVGEQMEAAQRRVSNADRTLSGRIRITAPDTLAQVFLWPLLADVVLAGALWSGHNLASFSLPLAVTPRATSPLSTEGEKASSSCRCSALARPPSDSSSS